MLDTGFDVKLIVSDSPEVVAIVGEFPGLKYSLDEAVHDTDRENIHIDVFRLALSKDVTGAAHDIDDTESRYLAAFASKPVILPDDLHMKDTDIGEWNENFLRWAKWLSQKSNSLVRLYYSYQSDNNGTESIDPEKEKFDIAIWDFDCRNPQDVSETFFVDTIQHRDGSKVRYLNELKKTEMKV